jgi:hypothetical protein
MAEESQHSEEPPWLNWFIWGGLLGAVFSIVAGAKGGATIAGSWVEGGTLASLLRIIGAVIGAIIAAPFGVVLGWIIGAIICEVIPAVLLSIPLLIALLFRQIWRKWISSLFARNREKQ